MKIVDIFADQLFSFVYKIKETDTWDLNEYDRLMELWTDVSYLREYAKTNGVKNPTKFAKQRLENAEEIQDLIEEITTQQKTLEYYFRPLNDNESGIKILSLQKGKIRNNGLRLYAIKIDENCFVITGGVIKMSHKMKDHKDSKQELNKIKQAKNYLHANDVIDKDSFFEFINE